MGAGGVGGHLHPSSRPNSIAGGAPPVSISPRGDSIYVHDAFASLVNAAAAQPSLPVPDRDRRDREREKERDPRGHLQSLPISRSMHPDRREEVMERTMAYQRESPKIASAPPGQTSAGAAAVGDATLTAASLIDAIITHQINQSSNPSELGSVVTNSKASNENYFNRYRRNASPVDTRGTTLDSRAGHKEQQRHEDPPPPSGLPSQQRPPSSSPSLPPPSSGSSSKAAFTLGEHIESIIAKDFHQGSGGGGGGMPIPGEQDWNPDWQRRQVEYSKSRMAAPESLMNDYAKNRAALDYAAKCRAGEGQQMQEYGIPKSGSGGGGEAETRQTTISPLDYVKKKIVEVMRTSSDGGIPAGGGGGGGGSANHEMAPPSSPARRGISPAPSPNKRPRMNEDERGGPSPVVPHYMSTPYPSMGYPYTIPSNVPMSSSAPTAVTSASASSTGNQTTGQPVVLLSSQYEVLSDED